MEFLYTGVGLFYLYASIYVVKYLYYTRIANLPKNEVKKGMDTYGIWYKPGGQIRYR